MATADDLAQDAGRGGLHWGLLAGALVFCAMLALPAPPGLSTEAWRVGALLVLMAIWWMTEAVPLTVTALLPFIIVPFTGVMSTGEIASAYYSPILFLVLGGAFIALAIERTGLHRRLALAVLARSGAGAAALLFAFMVATAVLSMIVSNTATALIMMPIALAVLRGGGINEGDTRGFAGALPLGIAFAASIGGLGTLVGSPTNAIAAGLIARSTGWTIDVLTWSLYGLPVVIVALPLCWIILVSVQRLGQSSFDVGRARAAIGTAGAWSRPERRLVPVVLLAVAGWIAVPLAGSAIPRGVIDDGSVAVMAALLLFILPDGTGRPLLIWAEANRAPWDIIMMFGGGLALASAITTSGLDGWIGSHLAGLTSLHPLILAMIFVALVILVTEFASNVATASGIVPIVAALIVTTGSDPALLAMSVAIAASWGFMLPAGTGPNAIAWATRHIALPRMLTAGLLLDIAGVPIIVGVVALVASLSS